MNTKNYECPCCGAPLVYSGDSAKLQCESCGTAFDPEALEDISAEGGESVNFAMPEEHFTDSDSGDMSAYVCKNCGAHLMTDESTTATVCAYCGSTTILPDRIEGGIKPEKVIPFKVDKAQAEKMFQDYFTGKRLLPNIFLNEHNRISEMRRLFVPYWLFDCDAEGDIVFNAEKTHSHRQGNYEVTTTQHFAVRRAGSMSFEGIPVNASAKMDEKIGESLEPYGMGEAVPFQPAVLSGALADHADVNAAECEGRAAERVESSMQSALERTVTGYSSVSVRSKSIRSRGGKVTPVLMPVWLITTEKQENGQKKVYTFAINGQTGKLTCDVPYAKGKFWAWFGGLFGGIGAAGLLLEYLFTHSVESGIALLILIAALIAALAVTGSMKAKLKTASHKTSASGYEKKNSFALTCKRDRFLYENSTRRPIQNNNK